MAWSIELTVDTPVFFLRDPAKFPHFIHTQKRDPATHLGGGDDSTAFWDYFSNSEWLRGNTADIQTPRVSTRSW